MIQAGAMSVDLTFGKPAFCKGQRQVAQALPASAVGQCAWPLPFCVRRRRQMGNIRSAGRFRKPGQALLIIMGACILQHDRRRCEKPFWPRLGVISHHDLVRE